MSPVLKQAELRSERLTRTPGFLRRLAMIWVIFAAAVLVFVWRVPWTQSVFGTGSVTVLSPMDRPQTVNAEIDGRLARWMVREGDVVSKGQALAELAEMKPEYLDPRLLQRRREALSAVELKREAARGQLRSYDALASALKRLGRAHLPSARLRKLQASADLDESGMRLFKAEQQAILAARLNFERVEALHAEGIRSARDLDVARREIAKVEGDVEKKLLETELKRSSALEKIGALESEVLKAQTELIKMERREGQRIVRSPTAGRVVKLLGVGAGRIFKQGSEMAVIAPETGDLAVDLTISDNDAPLVAPGRRVRLQFSGWPGLQLSGWPSAAVGTFAGRVAVVDASSDGRGGFRILVSPDEEAVNNEGDVPWPLPSQLRPGTQAAGWVLLDSVPLWFELWRRFNGFPPAIPDQEKSSKK